MSNSAGRSAKTDLMSCFLVFGRRARRRNLEFPQILQWNRALSIPIRAAGVSLATKANGSL
jgi:hypothetical protein